MTNPPTPGAPGSSPYAGRVLIVMFRKTMTALFAVIGAFTIGLVLVLALSAASTSDDDWEHDDWETGSSSMLQPVGAPVLSSADPTHGLLRR